MDILFWVHFLNGFLMIAIPIGLGIYLARRFKLGWRLWWIGAATFILSQVGHIPFNWAATVILNRTPLVNWPQGNQLVFNAIFLGLSAGLFEEFFRYGMYRWWVKDARSWARGLLAGAGHGGIEAIILGGLVLYGFIQMVIVRGTDLSTLVPAEQLAQAQQQVQAYWSLPWHYTLLGAVERLFAIPVHLMLSLLVMQTFTRRQGRWVWLAVAAHAVWDGMLVYLAGMGLSAYAIEGAAGLVAVIAVAIIFLLRQPEPQPEPEPAPESAPGFTPEPVAETQENLEKTKYQ